MLGPILNLIVADVIDDLKTARRQLVRTEIKVSRSLSLDGFSCPLGIGTVSLAAGGGF